MKGNLCKILLAVSFLFLMPNLCMSQNLKGIWRLVQNDATSQVTRYKVLDKEGKFYNVDAYVKNAMYLEAGNRGTGSVFCPYKITRSGIILLQKDFIVRYCIMNMEEPHQLLFLYPTGLTENE